ncbi:DoxX family protein [Yoonia litorea]|uniref:Putative oxidoreductase n=1 Tax=Yoonia litorea TaxID=1123755 RepID=A0A1I6MH86_9RHOB|nr:DoxX family protein [Yoonia litorea]SFS15070.1 putative oxidoreductase [Yoonia litorea]
MTSLPFANLARPLNRAGDEVLPLLARIIFAGVLLMYFWNSGLTKVGDGVFGIFNPSLGAYAQIFPKAMEAVGYDVSQLGIFHWAVVVAGTIAEFVLPLLLVIGLFTRLAALGMIGFVVVQSLTDLYGHGGIAHIETFGAWFDGASDALILDQRAFWILGLSVLVFKGAGALSIDRVLFRNAPSAHQAVLQQ